MDKLEQTTFFGNEGERGGTPSYRPLATRMRATSMKEVVGQRHLLDEKALLPRLISTNCFGSLLFYGPPGCGKTTLAEVIAHETGSKFVRINAVLSNVAELREILTWSRHHPKDNTILFIDEIHRFNKAQQDLLLPDVEEGNIRLIGATTHNPSFYIISPLISRSHLFRLEPLNIEDVVSFLGRALVDKERGLGNMQASLEEEVLVGLSKLCNGDLRKALNSLETLVMSKPIGSSFSMQDLYAFAKERSIRYDSDEEEHYDTISAFIKSVRGCDPDAAIYWLAKMIEGGEDPRFIARRLVILASEDVGLADSRGLPLAVAAFSACETIGMPECAINLAHATVFLATAPKSNASYMALNNAQEKIKKEGAQPVPVWLREGGTRVGKILGFGKDYLYSHNSPHNISGQEYMAEPETFYFPKDVGAEAAVRERMAHLKNLKSQKSKNS
ncbi:MAG: ATPase [Verrucomicrobia bacterium GWC2_42_7]|nr:MAG: ATPase [Verrucomicrobia bacterium GWC2_42_7]